VGSQTEGQIYRQTDMTELIVTFVFVRMCLIEQSANKGFPVPTQHSKHPHSKRVTIIVTNPQNTYVFWVVAMFFGIVRNGFIKEISLSLPIPIYIQKMQSYTVYFISKQLYMFRVAPPTIIRSANNCIYNIWYLSHSYCYLPLSWKIWNRFECAVGGLRHPQHTQTSSNSSTMAADSSNGVTNTGCYRYSCLRSWW
jgi:hypothetical protein